MSLPSAAAECEQMDRSIKNRAQWQPHVHKYVQKVESNQLHCSAPFSASCTWVNQNVRMFVCNTSPWSAGMSSELHCFDLI